MHPRVLIGVVMVVVMAALVASATPAAAQDVTAEVRMWNGQSWRLSQPSLEVFFTIVSKSQEQTTGAAGGGALGQMTGFSNLGLGILARQATDPSLLTLNRLFGSQAPDTIQGHRQGQEVTIYRGDAATQIPLADIASLTLKRQPVQNSTLPPYIAPTHFRYAANILLVDGTRIDADYINLGTATLRGVTPDGRVDIPWQEIEALSFTR